MIDTITYYADWAKRAYPLAYWKRLYHLCRRFDIPLRYGFEQRFGIKIDGIFYHYHANVEGMRIALHDIEQAFQEEISLAATNS